MTKLTAVVAMDCKRGIGIDNRLPWHFREDMVHFRETTKNGIVIMGRRTWDSLPSSGLKNRIPIVLTKTLAAFHNGKKTNEDDGQIELASGPEQALDLAWSIQMTNPNCPEIFVIGGAKIYEAFSPYLTHMIVTEISREYKCDTLMPEIPGNWVEQLDKRRRWCSDTDILTFRYLQKE